MLDIFRKERGGGVLWVGTAKDEEEVRAIFQEASRCKPRSIFHLRPYYANEANNQAGRVRRGRSALTTKVTPCRGPYVLLRPYGPQPVQGDRGWFAEDTLRPRCASRGHLCRKYRRETRSVRFCVLGPVCHDQVVWAQDAQNS